VLPSLGVRNSPNLGGTPSKFFAFFFFSFAVVWTAVTSISTFHEYASLTTVKKNGNVDVAEGVVTNFTPMPVTGHAMERFCDFAYRQLALNTQTTSSHPASTTQVRMVALFERVYLFGSPTLAIQS